METDGRVPYTGDGKRGRSCDRIFDSAIFFYLSLPSFPSGFFFFENIFSKRFGRPHYVSPDTNSCYSWQFGLEFQHKSSRQISESGCALAFATTGLNVHVAESGCLAR